MAPDAARAADPGDIQTILDGFRRNQDIPGISAVVIANCRTIYAGGSGVADVETSRPVSEHTKFYIGSMTKVLTSILVLNLMERDELSLRAPLANFTDFRNSTGDAVTIAHLLKHTSGLEREGDFGYWFTAKFPDRAALAAYLANTQLRFAPGTELHYSNIGFAALGLVSEAVTQQTFAEALSERVLQPLQMTSTGVPGPVEGIANGYTPRGRLMPHAAYPFAGVGRPIDERHERAYHDARAMSPAFGVYSTANDMGKLALFLLRADDSEILSAAAKERMRERQTNGRGLGVGLQRIDGRWLITHNGWFAAHRSQLLIDPHKGVAVVVLANSDNADPREIADALYVAALSGDD